MAGIGRRIGNHIFDTYASDCIHKSGLLPQVGEHSCNGKEGLNDK
jgi:hypothetical protein